MSGYEAKVILDSLAPCGVRLITVAATYPRMVHAELLTHRDRERNSSSSRAIPFMTMMESVRSNPVIPLRWGREKSGMQNGDDIPYALARYADEIWLETMRYVAHQAEKLHKIGESYDRNRMYLNDEERKIRIHKTLPNRMLEPWSWITVVMTATEWKNFFRLRCHPDAEDHFQHIAKMIRDRINNSIPVSVHTGQSHLPFVTGYDEQQLIDEGWRSRLRDISVARVARVSYLTHEGVRDPSKDVELFEKLLNGSGGGHWSPVGHVAQATQFAHIRSGPFRGWKQYRKEFPQENIEG